MPAERWTLRSILRRAGEIQREQGVRVLFWKVLGETVYRRLWRFERALSRPIPHWEPPAGVTVAELKPDQWRQLRMLNPELDADEVARRLRRGERCFVAHEDGRVVHSRWVAFQNAWCRVLGAGIPLSPGAFYVYECLTAAARRGRGIGPAVDTVCLRTLREEGFRTAVLVVDPENTSGLRTIRKTVYQRRGGVARLRLGPWRRVIHWGPPAGG